MPIPRPHHALLALGVLGAVAPSIRSPAAPRAAARLCSLAPGRTLALVRVERDTVLAFTPAIPRAMSSSSVPDSAFDGVTATPGTPMPAARVRLLHLDPVTRAEFARAGVAGDEPVAFIRAAPYGADCRTIRWTDTVPWVQRGDVGYVRATLAARELWIGGVPLLLIPDHWNYPYPRRRGLLYGAAPGTALAPADAMYSLHAALETPDASAPDEPIVRAGRASSDAQHAHALQWARSNPAAAELEPVRSVVERAILDADWAAAERVPSRLRGTYRVTMDGGDDARGTWYFRTHDRPGYRWRDTVAVRSTAALLASPHTGGYLLVGYAAGARDSLLDASPPSARRTPLVWLAAADRPTAPGNEARRALRGRLEFVLGAAPTALWDRLEAFAPPRNAQDSAAFARIGHTISRADRQPRLPLTLRLDAAGGVRADTTLTAGGRALRVSLERVDTLSVRRLF